MSTLDQNERSPLGLFAAVLDHASVVLFLSLCVPLTLSLVGCGGSGGLKGSQAAPALPEFNDQEVYTPYYATGDMSIARYFHGNITLDNGQILVVGGTDENGFSALDQAEIFDQGTTQKDQVEPESGTGTWFDTNFEGDPMLMEVARIYHTLTTLPDNTVIVIGGSQNLTLASPVSNPETFDPLTRTFETLDVDMVNPRFSHTATPLSDGRILLVGGQELGSFTMTTQATVGGPGQQQPTQLQTTRTIFPSLKTSEFYSIVDQDFFPLTVGDSQQLVELTSSRGRSGHGMGRFAGPDNRLSTGDDLFLVAGGYQTLSGENAPEAKIPSLNEGGTLENLEFFDPIVGVFTEVPVVRLNFSRVNTVQINNLGRFNQETPDGVLGMGNAILVCNGDDDGGLGRRDVAVGSELYIATFTGFGPAQGLQLFSQGDPQNEHNQGNEATTASGGIPEVVFGVGRSTSNVVVLPRDINSSATTGTGLGGRAISTWIFAGSGVHVVSGFGPGPQPIGSLAQIEYYEGTIRAGVVFDPFYSVTAIVDFGESGRSLEPGRRNVGNPLGVIGTWLAMDGELPNLTLIGYGDTSIANFGRMRAPRRVYGTLTQIPGEDGITNTVDDRVLFVGGGDSLFEPGGEPSFPSAEIFLPPGTGSDG